MLYKWSDVYSSYLSSFVIANHLFLSLVLPSVHSHVKDHMLLLFVNLLSSAWEGTYDVHIRNSKLFPSQSPLDSLNFTPTQ